MKKLKSLFALVAVCGMLSFGSNDIQSADFWVGVAALADYNGASTGAGALIGVTGVAHSALWGAAVGGPAGAAAGAAFGL